MRNLITIVTLVIILATEAFAQPSALRAAAVPEPGTLVAIGGGLVGLAAWVRRRLDR